MKQFLKESKSFNDVMYYFKRCLNGELGYLKLASVKSPDLSTATIIDLELEKSFTTASSFKLLYMNREVQLVEKVPLIKSKNELLFKDLRLKYVKEDYTPSEIKRGDVIMINKEGDFGFYLAEKEKNEEKILIGRVLNEKGLTLLEEIHKKSHGKDIEHFQIREFSTLRKRILIKLMHYYVILTFLGFFLVHFCYADQMDRPLVPDKRLLHKVEEKN